MGKQWDADITVTSEMVQTLLSCQFPALDPTEVHVLDSGWDNAVFLVDGDYVFRFPRRRIAVELIETENRLLPWLSSRLPVPIPNPIFVGAPSIEYPFPFSGYRRIEGSVPHQANLSDGQRAGSATRLAWFLRTLHDIPTALAMDRGVPPSDTFGRMDIGKRLPMLRERVEEALGAGLIDDPRALFSEMAEVSKARWDGAQTRSLVHGDLNFRNFLVEGDGVIMGVIDWGDAHIGRPAIDLSLVYSYLPPYARPQFFRVYGAVDDETVRLARFRALYTNVVILLYAHDIGDAKQTREARRAISNALVR